MYLYHYGLHRLPFALTPDTGFFCELPGHRAALNVVHVALATGEGFVKLTGEVGTGKTLLCRQLLRELQQHHPRMLCAYLPNPYLEPPALRMALAHELEIRLVPGASEAMLARHLELRLIGLAAEGRQVVLLVDEAQALPDASLEALRLLSNLETEQRKLLQIVLLGQPELDARLRQPRFRQLRQRIAFSARLSPLTRRQLQTYLSHRLRAAGHQTGELLTPPALLLLGVLARGIPRLAHILAHKALMLSYGQGRQQAGWWQVWTAARDTEDVTLHLSRASRPWALLAAGMLATGAALSAHLGGFTL